MDRCLGMSADVTSIDVCRTGWLVDTSTNAARTVTTAPPGAAETQMRKCPTCPPREPKSCCTPQSGQATKTSPDGAPLEDNVYVTRGTRLATSPNVTSANASQPDLTTACQLLMKTHDQQLAKYKASTAEWTGNHGDAHATESDNVNFTEGLQPRT